MNNKAKNNFGTYGWFYIIFTGLLFYMNTGIAVDGLNVTIEAFCSKNNWVSTTLLNYSSIAGYISIAGAFFFGWLISKKGTRFVMSGCLLIGGIFTILWGNVNSPIQYFVCCTLVFVCGNAYSHIASSNLAAVWFPKKKGLFLGWSTMGIQLSTVAFVAMMAFLIGRFGLTIAYYIVGVISIIFAIIAFLFVKDTPEEIGKFPDNEEMTTDELEKSKQEMENYVSQWSVIDFFKIKEVWFIGISFGILYMTSTGILSQWVPRLISFGYTQNTAILMLSIAAAIGIAGSYIWGWIDVKIGPKKASVGIMIWYVVTTFLFVLPFSKPILYIAVIMIGLSIGGVANLVASLTGTIFGRHEFARAFGVINPISGVVRVTAYTVLAFGLKMLGGYSGAHAIFLALTIIATILTVLIKEDAFVNLKSKNQT